MKSKPPSVEVKQTSSSIRIAWPHGTTVVFALEKGTILGIRDVIHKGIAQRSTKRLWRPIITTPLGLNYHTFKLVKVDVAKNGSVVVRAKALGSPCGIKEEQDEYLCDVYDVNRPDEVVEDLLEWHLAPSQREIDGQSFAGFSYQYRFTTTDASRAICRLFDDATWEITGTVNGNTLLFQGQCNPPASKLSKSMYYTTACNYYGAEMKGIMGIPKRVSFQRLPRFGTIQAFDMLTHAKGALVGLYEPLNDVFAVLQSAQGEDYLHVIDEIRRPLTKKWVGHTKHMLFLEKPKNWARHDQRNLWHFIYDMVHNGIRARYKVERSPIHPRVWIPQVYQDEFEFRGNKYPRSQGLRVWADQAVPEWAAMGVKEICVHSLWNSDYTEDRAKTKDTVGGLHGQLVVGSICNMRNHEVAPLWGGVEGLKYLVDATHKNGMQLQVWWATHMSRRAPILAQRPDFMMIARDGLANGGGFGHQSIITLDLNNPDCYKYVRDGLIAAHDATGFDGLFHDSYGNMTFLPMNYSDSQRRSQQDAYAKLVHEFQQAGIKTFTVEGIGPLGVSHFGMDLFAGHAVKRGNYQHVLDWWLGEEDMAYGINMGVGTHVKPEREEASQKLSFRFLAFGGRFGFTAGNNGIEGWTGWIRDHNQIEGRLGQMWGRRTLLPKDQGVLWKLDSGANVLFAFNQFDHALPSGIAVSHVTPDCDVPVQRNANVLTTQPMQVYRWA